MSRKTYIRIIVLCVFLLVVLLVWWSSDTPMSETTQILQSKDTATASQGVRVKITPEAPITQGYGDKEEPKVSEQWIRPFEEGDTTIDQRRFSHIFWTLYTEFELRVLAKYADWTEEQRKQRFWALQGTGDRSEAVRLEESELIVLPGVRRREQSRINPPSSWEAADDLMHRSSIYTKEVDTLGEIRRKSQLTDEDRKTMNQIIARLNRAISSNKAILTYDDDLRNSWGLPPPIEEEDFE